MNFCSACNVCRNGEAASLPDKLPLLGPIWSTTVSIRAIESAPLFKQSQTANSGLRQFAACPRSAVCCCLRLFGKWNRLSATIFLRHATPPTKPQRMFSDSLHIEAEKKSGAILWLSCGGDAWWTKKHSCSSTATVDQMSPYRLIALSYSSGCVDID